MALDPAVGFEAGAAFAGGTPISVSGTASSLAAFGFLSRLSRPSGSSGNMAINPSPVDCSIGLMRASLTHSGCAFWGTSQLKNTNAITQSKTPRTAPNTNPSERSSGPTFE